MRHDLVAGHRHFAGAVADGDADDVRPFFARGCSPVGAPFHPRPLRRKRLRARPRRLRPLASLVARQCRGDAHHPDRGRRAQRLPLYDRAEGLLPAAGHRRADRRPARRPGHFLPIDAAEIRAAGDDPEERPGGGERRRLYRRPPDQLRLRLCQPEAEGRSCAAASGAGRLRAQLRQLPGAQLFLNPRQEIRVGGRQSLATYQYTLQADTTADLDEWAPKLVELLKQARELTDVNSDRDEAGLETNITVDRESAARLGLTPASIDNTLYDAFGQRQVSTIFNARNQYHVVMEVAPRYLQDPSALNGIYVSTSGAAASGTQKTNALAGSLSGSLQNQATNAIAVTGHGSASSGAAVSTSAETMVPLAAFSTYGPATTPLSVNHQGHFVATTISFNLADGATLGDASAEIDRAMAELKMPVSIHGSLAGTALAFRSNLLNELLLIAAALATIYVVLGVLYESYVHPITILSTLPSAGIGALLALIVTGMEFDVISLIGIILLIGIVKKNAIMMIDRALQAERQEGLAPREAIHKASLQRFRPIMMTTFAALLGALPLALETGTGAELRQPLGIAIVGGLIVSQLLTLYTTPVVYLYLDRLSARRPMLRVAPAE
ncbi:hypothetical protein EOA91_16635 [Mesorhizobium sp. M1A.F.Ca.IN.022.04.1.1]|nr:hypothetical protein EOA91_16635 [Mesorhizobium sp. M1A.F.Ca.IN.022.04.1.1]